MKTTLWGSLMMISLCCCCGIFPVSAQQEGTDNAVMEKIPSLMNALRVDQPLDFCGEAVPLDNPQVRERFEKEMVLSVWDRAQVILWLKRANRYFPVIEDALKKRGMPDDLKFLAVAESALRPHAGSRKGAMGFWQFMRATARKYGLQVDNDVDERRNIFHSTAAALAYLQFLYDDLGSWSLAAAGYNMGEGRLKSEMTAQETKDYYNLYLSLETQRYLFRIIAIKRILSAPEQFGFYLAPDELYPPLLVETISFDLKKETPIQAIARAANVYFKTIKDLNPQLRGHSLKKGDYVLLVPGGHAKVFAKNFPETTRQWQGKQKQRIYVVKKGDNLSAIAARFNIPLASLYLWNPIKPGGSIYPGDKLVVYTGDDGR